MARRFDHGEDQVAHGNGVTVFDIAHAAYMGALPEFRPAALAHVFAADIDRGGGESRGHSGQGGGVVKVAVGYQNGGKLVAESAPQADQVFCLVAGIDHAAFL